MHRLLEQRDETLRAFRHGLIRTGEVGYQGVRKGNLYILDRVKDMIVKVGEKVYSGEVEAVLYEHPAIREDAVVGIPDAGPELVMAGGRDETGDRDQCG